VRFSCPYLAGEVELTEERAKHIGERHPELLPEICDRIRATLADPDEVRPSPRSTTQKSRLRGAENHKKDAHPRGMCVIEILGEILDTHPEGEQWNQAYRN
jgi:hypothetical protein